MIDFRYHLVSIASVFLALAVGIVLGAGPLRGTIGDTLAGEVTRLREEANTLRSDLSTAQAQGDARDEALAQLRARSVATVLDGTSVAVVELPGASDSGVEGARAVLAEAGAVVAGPVALTRAWASEEPPDVAARAEAAASLRELLAGELPVGLAPERVIDLSLAHALAAGTDDETVEQPTTPVDGGVVGESADPADGEDPARVRVLEILSDNGLLAETGDPLSAPADAVVVIAPDAPADGASVVSGWVDVIGALDEQAGVVVGANLGPDATAETDLVTAVRDSGDLAGRISTLDNLATASGTTALPFAVLEQSSGTAGHYGSADNASALLPPVKVPER